MLGGEEKTRLTFLNKAIDCFHSAYRLYPQNADISMYLGRTFDGLRKFDEAEKWWQIALQWGDGSRLIHHYYGDHLMAVGNYRLAVDHYIPAMHRQTGWKRTLLEKKINHAVGLIEKKRKESPPVPPAAAPDAPK